MTTPAYRLVRPARPVAPAPVLDAAQRQVVEHDAGPLLVLAGPGTGKTTTLVEAAAARVAAGVPVEALLLLTFSRRAAGELRDRLAARLDRTVREPVARTLHSYAFGVLRLAAVRRGDPAPRLLAAAEQDVVIRELLAGGDAARWPAALRPALRTLGFATEVRDLLMRAVERGLDGPSLAELGRRRSRPDWVAAGEFLDEYQGVTVLRDAGGYDPAELIQGAIGVLHDDPELLAAERARRRRIFVDEYQDTDPAQAELLALLAHGADELVLVGDPDQSIYAFRGADERAMTEVDARYGRGGTVPVVALHRCRRSGPTLVDASRRIAARLPGRGEQRALQPVPDAEPGDLTVAVFRSPSEEAAYLAGRLRAAHLSGTPWSRMAVLVRSTNRTLGVLRRAMITAGVPVAVRGDDLPLAEQPAVTMLLSVLACAEGAAGLSEVLAEELVLGPLGGGDAVYLRRLRRELRRGAVVPRDVAGARTGNVGSDALAGDGAGGTGAVGAGSVGSDPADNDPADGDPADGDPADGDPADGDPAGGDPAGGLPPVSGSPETVPFPVVGAAPDALAPLLLDPAGVAVLPERVRRPVERVSRTLAAARAAFAAGATVEDILWAAWEASRLAGRWESASAAGGTVGAAADRDLDAVIDLFAAAAAFTDRLPEARPALFAEHVRAQQIPGDTLIGGSPTPDAVGLLTAHAAKGLEWDLVCVAAVQEGSWPDLRRRGSLLGSETLVETVAGVADGPLASLAPQLAEERRLFYVAVTRARHALVVTAVAGDEEQPSRFLDELDPLDHDRPLQPPMRGVHLPGLVAELRAVVCDDDGADDERAAAADALSLLADAGIRGSDPDDWWGLADLSSPGGAADPDRPVRIRPSQVESFGVCELRDVLLRFGAGDQQHASAGMGSQVHDVAERAPADASVDQLETLLDERWQQIDFGADWLAANERERASAMLRRLHEWLVDSRDQLDLVAREAEFRVEIGDALLTGRVDRLERDRQGRLVIVDLKTGRTRADDVATNPQLGTYQLAVTAGGFAPHGDVAGGGRLVQLGVSGALTQDQPPLDDADDPQWIHRLVESVAARLRGAHFTARENKRCHVCEVRSSCPVQPVGRQVTQ